MTGTEREATLDDVLGFLDLVDGLGADVWLDGGWAVDTCLGAQTRPHGDLDIAIEERHVPAVVAALRERGWIDVLRDDIITWNFVLGDGDGLEVDFHVIVIDPVTGDGIYGPAGNGDRYPAAALANTERLAGREVRCLTPECLVAFHTGYDVDDDDWADVSALCERFRIPVPDDYSHYVDRR